MIKSSCFAEEGTRRKRKSPNGWQTSSGRSALRCTPQELINVSLASASGFAKWACGTNSSLRIIEPGYRSLIVCHRPGRNCVPVSRGSTGRIGLSAAVMNPPPRLADQGEMQMKKQQGQSRVILLQHLADEFAV